MKRQKKTYTLKLYDEALLSFSTEVDALGTFTLKVLDVNANRQAALPMNMLLDPSDENVFAWLSSRTIPKNRQFVERICEWAGVHIDDTMAIIDICKGLSVNDAYWVDDGSSTEKFEDINLYDNDLDETLSLVAYTGYTPSQKHKLGISTEWTTNGQFPKAWRRIDNELVLYKAELEFGAANDGMTPYSEFLASQLADHIDLPHVHYNLDQWKGKLASTCRLVNNKDVGLVSFYAATKKSLFPEYLSIGYLAGAEYLEALRSMTVFDALIANTDRHAGNYGFLRDNMSGRILGVAPLFDHNMALFPRDMEEDFPHFLDRANSVLSPANTSALSFTEECEIVMGEQQHEMLRKAVGFEFQNHPTYPMPENRLEALNNYIKARAAELLKIPVVKQQEFVRSLEMSLEQLQDTNIALLHRL